MHSSDIKKAIKQAQDGDQEAFGQLFDCYHDRIVNYAFRRTLDIDIAQDIASVVFLKVIDGLPTFRWQHEYSFSGWIFRICSNEINQYYRKKGRYKHVDDDTFEAVMPDIDRSRTERRSVEQEIDTKHDFVYAMKHIQQLKPKQQDIIHMHFFEQLSSKEIATALRMREGAVRTALHRSLAKLRKEMQAYEVYSQERSTTS